jgi:hypothetical protein
VAFDRVTRLKEKAPAALAKIARAGDAGAAPGLPDRKHWMQAIERLFNHISNNKAVRTHPDVAAAFARAVTRPGGPKEAFVGLAMTNHPDAETLLDARRDDPDPTLRQWVAIALDDLDAQWSGRRNEGEQVELLRVEWGERKTSSGCARADRYVCAA